MGAVHPPPNQYSMKITLWIIVSLTTLSLLGGLFLLRTNHSAELQIIAVEYKNLPEHTIYFVKNTTDENENAIISSLHLSKGNESIIQETDLGSWISHANTFGRKRNMYKTLHDPYTSDNQQFVLQEESNFLRRDVIHVKDNHTSQTSQLLPFVPSEILWLPDSEHVVYTYHNAIWIISVTHKQTAKLTDAVGHITLEIL